jgi:hypothetical protein
MGIPTVSQRILSGIKEKSEGDKLIEHFLVDLIYEEASHTGQWHWKEAYMRLVEGRSEEWGDTHEDSKD